jgi:hypothetical protein
MATTSHLEELGFQSSIVAAVRLNIGHPDPLGLGPFCRLKVTTTAPLSPGVYAWVVEEEVRYVGVASFLIHVVNGARMQRAYNDYTYVPASKVAQTSSPSVRVNELLNRRISEGHTLTWWWLALDSLRCKGHGGAPHRGMVTTMEPSPASHAVTAAG